MELLRIILHRCRLVPAGHGTPWGNEETGMEQRLRVMIRDKLAPIRLLKRGDSSLDVMATEIDANNAQRGKA